MTSRNQTQRRASTTRQENAGVFRAQLTEQQEDRLGQYAGIKWNDRLRIHRKPPG